MKKFHIKDLILLALVVATIFVLGYVLTPFMQLLPLPAFRAILVAPIYAIGVTVITAKVNRIGIISLLGLLIGALLSTFFIWMFFIALLGGVITEFIVYLFARNYTRPKTIFVASGIFPAIQLPLTFYVAAYTLGGLSSVNINRPLIIIGPTIFTFLLGYFTSIFVYRALKRRNI